MQVGLGRDRKFFNGEGDKRHVFVGAGKFFLYCGWYHVVRVEPLTQDEWAMLPPKVCSSSNAYYDLLTTFARPPARFKQRTLRQQ